MSTTTKNLQRLLSNHSPQPDEPLPGKDAQPLGQLEGEKGEIVARRPFRYNSGRRERVFEQVSDRLKRSTRQNRLRTQSFRIQRTRGSFNVAPLSRQCFKLSGPRRRNPDVEALLRTGTMGALWLSASRSPKTASGGGPPGGPPERPTIRIPRRRASLRGDASPHLMRQRPSVMGQANFPN